MTSLDRYCLGISDELGIDKEDIQAASQEVCQALNQRAQQKQAIAAECENLGGKAEFQKKSFELSEISRELETNQHIDQTRIRQLILKVIRNA